MEINKILNVEAEEFFHVLASSAAYDIREATGEKINPEQIYAGLSYKKMMKNKLGQESQVEVLIRQFSPPSCYEACFYTSHGTNVIYYKIEDSKDGNIMVHYRESFEGGNSSYSLNYRISSWFYQKGLQKRITKMLLSIENFIQRQRVKVNESNER